MSGERYHVEVRHPAGIRAAILVALVALTVACGNGNRGRGAQDAGDTGTVDADVLEVDADTLDDAADVADDDALDGDDGGDGDAVDLDGDDGGGDAEASDADADEPEELPEPDSIVQLLPTDRFMGFGPAGDTFGRAVALGDGFLVVSADEDDDAGVSAGAVFTYGWTGEAWSHIHTLRPPDAESEEKFGRALALDGTTLVVGAPASSRAGLRSGAAFVFERDGDGWAHVTTLLPSEPRDEGHFGTAVGVSGARIAIGESFFADPPVLGRVYVYELEDDAWGETGYFQGLREGEEDGFGLALALEGDTLLVGAQLEGGRRGTVYAWFWNGSEWVGGPTEVPESVVARSFYGSDVALDGDRAVAGAFNMTSGEPGGGAAFVLERTEGTWSPVERLDPTEITAGGRFGDRVAIDGDRIAIGAYRQEFDSERSGAVHLFERDGETWTDAGILGPGEGGEGARLGRWIAMDGDRIAVGAVEHSAAGDDAGALFVFDRVESEWIRTGPITSPRATDGDAFGTSVAAFDGVLLVGSPGADTDGPEAGLVDVYARDEDGWFYLQRASAPRIEPGARFGQAIATSSTSAVVGAPGAGDGAGAAWVFDAETGPGLRDSVELGSGSWSPGDAFGASVAHAGDYIAIGAPGASGGRGEVMVFSRAADWDLAAGAFLAGVDEGYGFGATVAMTPDLLAVGAPDAWSGRGDVTVFEHDDGVLSPGVGLSAEGLEDGARFGASIAIAGGRVFVGAPGALDGVGTVRVFERGDDGWVEVTRLGAELSTASATLGTSLSAEGARVFAGASTWVGAWLLGDDGSEWEATFDSEPHPSAAFGASLDWRAGVLLVGAPETGTAGWGAGAAYVFE